MLELARDVLFKALGHDAQVGFEWILPIRSGAGRQECHRMFLVVRNTFPFRVGDFVGLRTNNTFSQTDPCCRLGNARTVMWRTRRRGDDNLADKRVLRSPATSMDYAVLLAHTWKNRRYEYLAIVWVRKFFRTRLGVVADGGVLQSLTANTALGKRAHQSPTSEASTALRDVS